MGSCKLDLDWILGHSIASAFGFWISGWSSGWGKGRFRIGEERVWFVDMYVYLVEIY